MILRTALVALLSCAPVLAAPGAFDPAHTVVFAVSLARFQGDRLHDFDPAGRIDGDFEEMWLKLGVPRDRVVMLKDDAATAPGVRRGLDRALAASRPGDTLVFYFGSHGGYDAAKQTWSFSTFESWLPYDWAVDAIEKRFRGERALMTTDCCYSGGILEVVRRHAKSRIGYACLSSMDAHASGSNVWRFMRWLMRGFTGDPRADLDGDGAIELDELARATRHELAFLRGTSPLFLTQGQFDPHWKVSAASGPKPADAGRLVVLRDGTRAVLEQAEPARVQVRRGDDDSVGWVPADHVSDPPPPLTLASGARVWIGSTCCASEVYRPAKVLEPFEGLLRCQPEGFGAAYAEWVASDNLRPGLTGTWRGHYTNSVGERAVSRLDLTESPDGALSGSWDGVTMRGDRLGGTVAYLTGKTKTRDYRMILEVDSARVRASYVALRPDGSRYYGRAELVAKGEDAPLESAIDVRLTGDWAGKYTNSKGQGGDETLAVHEADSGDIDAVWTDNTRVLGQRCGADAFFVEGTWGGRRYRIAGRVRSGELELKYAAISADGSRYWGESKLKQ